MQGPSPRFRSEEKSRIRDIRRNVLPKFTEICMESPWQQKHLLPSFATKA